MATDAQQACFEAGIKFGSLYHQFAGTPVSPMRIEHEGVAVDTRMTMVDGYPLMELVEVRDEGDSA